jgi:hypothetical protein
MMTAIWVDIVPVRLNVVARMIEIRVKCLLGLRVKEAAVRIARIATRSTTPLCSCRTLSWIISRILWAGELFPTLASRHIREQRDRN